MPSSSATNYLQLERRLRDFPLQRDLTHYTVRERWLESYDTYSRLALDTAHASPFGTAYLVNETTIDDLENIKRYERLWSTIPGTWQETRTVGYDYPGFITTWGTAGTLVTSGLTAALDANKNLVITKTAHGLSNGNFVEINYTSLLNGGIKMYAQATAPISGVAANTFTVPHQFLGATWSFTVTSYRLRTGYPGRSLRTFLPNAKIIHEYALPGVTTGVATSDDFQAMPKMLFLDAAGDPVTALNATTVPTNVEYLARVTAGNRLVADSIVQPYIEGGNILERITTLVPYLA